jgi:signal transduction histidine kinase/ActR/RegA family two-component response regulator
MFTDDQYPASAKHAEMLSSSPSLGLRFKAIFTIALVLLVLTIALAIKTTRNQATARQWVLHTHEVIECLAELGERASSRELALRNRLRSGDARFVERYQTLDKETTELSDKLITLTADNPIQAKSAMQLDELMDKRALELGAMLKAYSSENSESLLAANSMPSTIMLGQMEDAMTKLRNEERRLLVERGVQLDRTTGFIDLLIPAIGVTGLLVLLGCQVAVGRYVKEISRSHAEAECSKKSADKANAFKSAFLANVSHEIRTPLAAILGYADILRTDERLSSHDRDEYLRTIRRSGEQVLTIVNDLLDLSKIEVGRMTIELIPCCVVEVIADVASLFRRVASDRGLFFEVKYVDPIPEQVRTDPMRLRQMLMNLVGNAVKFTERGGVRLIIDLFREATNPPMLRVRVIDTGIGLTPEIAATLFQPFVQADVSTTRRFGGTGLGLTISRHFAELLGGTISIESEMGRGSTFTITVDPGDLRGVRMLSGVEEASRSPRQPLEESTPRMNGKRFLVVEDGSDNQQIIRFHLRQAGADVTLAENGKAAVQFATAMADANRPYDLILMDMQMPVMDGYTATTMLRQDRYTGPIVALTANAMAHDRDKCLAVGCNGFITKPIQWPVFWATVRRFVTESPAPVEACGAQLNFAQHI